MLQPLPGYQLDSRVGLAEITRASPAGPTGAATGEPVGKPPLPLLAAALVVGAVGALSGTVALSSASALWAFSGWLLAGPGVIGVLTSFVYLDVRRRIAAPYPTPNWLTNAYLALALVCALGLGASAWQIALSTGAS